ncbi:carboxypeptidase M32 [Desulfocurvus sp. DL9XJH121]
MPPREAYDWLRAHSVETGILESMGALLHWDQSTMMPRGGHAHRSDQLACLAALVHARRTDPRVGEALADCGAQFRDADPRGVEAGNLRHWRRAHDRAVRIPPDLAVALARAASDGEQAWKRARAEDDWDAFLPHLETILSLRREEAEAVGYAGEPYDALLDEYEPGATAAALEPLFRDLRPRLAALLERIQDAPRAAAPSILNGHFPREAQRRFCRMVIETLGYDTDAGRLDSTAHPFSTRIGPGDVRITTRYHEEELAPGLFGAIHEAGHALYSQGLPAEHFGTPAGHSVSLGMHESQSRLWENLVARSRGFWEHFHPLAREWFKDLRTVDLDAMHLAVNDVRPGLVRTEADEVTYNLHIMVRFELELALMRGALEARDLPEAFDRAMEKYLGLVPPTRADGVMQDVHWAAGLLGYFPTYTLGNVYAAQLYEAAQGDLGPLEPLFARGEFAPLLAWLRERVHAWGKRLDPAGLILQATGREPDADALVRGLTRKYEALYRL